MTLTDKVTQLRPGANNQRYTVNLTLDHPPPNVMIDMTGEMNIISGERKDALIIPTRAILSDRVWVVDGGIARPRMVKVGFRNPERAGNPRRFARRREGCRGRSGLAPDR